MLSKIRHYIPKNELKSIYHAISASHMTYGCQVWGQGYGSHIEKIFKLQKRALRIINFKDFRAHTNPLFKDNEILKLQDFIKLQNCLFVYDYLNTALPECFEDYFFRLNSMYFNVQTRNSNLGCLFSPSKKTTKYGLQSITQKSIYSWNYLTKHLKTDLTNMSRYKLKSILTKHFLNQY